MSKKYMLRCPVTALVIKWAAILKTNRHTLYTDLLMSESVSDNVEKNTLMLGLVEGNGKA